MESQEQAFFLTDDSHLNFDANFCSLQSEVQTESTDAGSECPIVQEPSIVETSAPLEGGINIDELPAEVVPSVVHDGASSALENGREPDSSSKSCIVSSDDSGCIDKDVIADDGSRAGVCIGTIVSVHEQANTISPKQSAAVTAEARKVQETTVFGRLDNRVDYGESVAMEDFGGEFEDGHGIDESTFPSVDVFALADSEVNKPDKADVPPMEVIANDGDDHVQDVRDDAVDTTPQEPRDMLENFIKLFPKSPVDDLSPECEEEPPVLERESISADGIAKQNHEEEYADDDAEKPSSPRKSRRQREAVERKDRTSDVDQLPTSNLELNINSRPRRSVHHKTVFELLHVEYRHASGPKKVATRHLSDGEMNHESSAKKQRSSRRVTKVSNELSETPVKITNRDHVYDTDDQTYPRKMKKKVVGYQPDDFPDVDDVEPEVAKNTDSKEKKASLDADARAVKESLFAEADDIAARSFLSVFAAETAEALSSSKRVGDAGSELDALIAENQQLRSRIKVLEQSKSLVRKFNIDFHGRKFSRIRSPAIAATPDQQKTPGSVLDRTPAAEEKAPFETGESMLMRMAMLDRRELKLRELSAELDERATTVKIAEGALCRRERKLVDFEKTLEHRERVLSRHEQSILKRELLLGSPSLPEGNLPTEDAEDRQSLAAEIQRRLEQRRLELDRRQAALNSERSRLEIRERELDRREGSSKIADESSSRADEDGGGQADPADHGSSHLSKHVTSIGKQKRKTSVSHSIRSKYLSPKKQKVSVEL